MKVYKNFVSSPMLAIFEIFWLKNWYHAVNLDFVFIYLYINQLQLSVYTQNDLTTKKKIIQQVV